MSTSTLLPAATDLAGSPIGTGRRLAAHDRPATPELEAEHLLDAAGALRDLAAAAGATGLPGEPVAAIAALRALAPVAARLGGARPAGIRGRPGGAAVAAEAAGAALAALPAAATRAPLDRDVDHLGQLRERGRVQDGDRPAVPPVAAVTAGLSVGTVLPVAAGSPVLPVLAQAAGGAVRAAGAARAGAAVAAVGAATCSRRSPPPPVRSASIPAWIRRSSTSSARTTLAT